MKTKLGADDTFPRVELTHISHVSRLGELIFHDHVHTTLQGGNVIV